KIFPLINDLHKQLTWIPFDKDPAAKRSFSGAAAGKGASYAWDGNSDVGAGSIEIVDATAPSKVTMKLDMVRPLEGHNIVEFTLDPGPGADATNVTWAMHGEQPFLGKLMSTFIDCETMVGSEFEKGLAKLKSLAENQVAQ
ncbi:MAG TPA: SRPBCC family protein, partial [Hyphomicrobium sp.]